MLGHVSALTVGHLQGAKKLESSLKMANG